MTTYELVTLSFSRDFEACRLMCESADRFVPESMEHRIIVPRADLALFAPLASARRRLVAEEDILPWWFRRMPMPSPRWRSLLRLPRRNIYLTPFSMPVRGWIAQQLMKIASVQQSKADVVVHIDSDTVFVRPLRPEHLCKDGRVRLYRDPKPAGLDTHALWQKVAGRLFGLQEKPFYGGEYIDSCVVWKTSVLRGMTDHIARISGSDWLKTLCRTPHFSEYVLYGVYSDQVVGVDKAGLLAESFSLCHSRWSGDFENDAEIDAFIEAVEPHHVTCLIQSTIDSSLDARRDIFARVTEFAARQDAAGG